MVTPHKPDDAPKAKVLVHAPPKHGKTRLLGTAQEDQRTYPMAFLNFEAGDSTLVGLDIDVFDVFNAKDFDEVIKELQQPNCKFNSVGLDSVTEMQIGTLLQILDTDTVNRADPDQLAQQDWGIVLIRMRRVIRQIIKTLPMHVFMTALTAEKIVPRLGSVRAPSLQGQFAAEFAGIPDIISYLALEEDAEGQTQRVLLLHDYPKFSVGVRTPWNTEVPSEIVDPTVAKLLDALGY